MHDIYRKIQLGNITRREHSNSLSRDPAPKLKRVFANSPATREVAESPCVEGVLGESERVLVVVQIEFANLNFKIREYKRRIGKSLYLEIDAICQNFSFCPTLGAWRENSSRAKHREQTRIRILIVPCFPSPFPNDTRRRQRLTSRQPRIPHETPRNTPFCIHNALSNPPGVEGGQRLSFQGAAMGGCTTKQPVHGDCVCV